MGLLDGGGAALLGRIFAPLYLPGRVHTNLTVYDRYGEPSTVTNATPCRIQIDAMTEGMRAAEGAADSDRRAIVLVGDGVSVDTDASLSADSGPYAGSRWLVMSIDRDPLGAYFQCRVRRDPSYTSQIIRYLSGGVTGDSALFAAFSLGNNIAGIVQGSSNASASLSVRAQLIGSIVGTSALAGAIGNGSTLSGIVSGSSALTGAISVANNITGDIAGTSAASGVLTAYAAMTGSVAGIGNLGSSLTVVSALSGAANGVGALSGIMSTRANIAGAITGGSALTGVITTRASLSGAVNGAGTVAGTITNQAGVAYDPDAQAYFAAMTVQPDATRKGLINDLIAGLKADGVWTLIEPPSYLFASHDDQAGRLSIKTPGSYTAGKVNTPTFTADRGFVGDGNSAYLATGWNPSTGAISGYSQNSAAVYWWMNTTSNSTGYDFGNPSGAGPQGRFPNAGTGARINLNTAANTFFTLATGTGGVGSSRTNGTQQIGYRAGVATAPLTIASAAITATSYDILRGVGLYSDRRQAAHILMSGATSAQMAALDARLNTFLTAIGAN